MNEREMHEDENQLVRDKMARAQDALSKFQLARAEYQAGNLAQAEKLADQVLAIIEERRTVQLSMLKPDSMLWRFAEDWLKEHDECICTLGRDSIRIVKG
ncbi:MAG: hypothetical protein ABSG21_15950 [Spirochaetia bacterium]|jgi:predicted nucleic acid-binding protein